MNVLVECFKDLPKQDLLRLKFHLEKGTEILCGDDAYIYLRNGAG